MPRNIRSAAVLLFTSVFFAFMVTLRSSPASPSAAHYVIERDYTLIEDPEDYFLDLSEETESEEPRAAARGYDAKHEIATQSEESYDTRNYQEGISRDFKNSDEIVNKEFHESGDQYFTHHQQAQERNNYHQTEDDEEEFKKLVEAQLTGVHTSFSSSTLHSSTNISSLSSRDVYDSLPHSTSTASTTLPTSSSGNTAPSGIISRQSSNGETDSRQTIGVTTFHQERNGATTSRNERNETRTSRQNSNGPTVSSSSRSAAGYTPRRPFGSHPLPPLWTFQVDGGEDKWIAYFHDQAITMVHFTPNGTVDNCTVLEVIEVWEQREALRYLGQVMPLQPVSLQHMIHLVSLCGALTTPSARSTQPSTPSAEGPTRDKEWDGLLGASSALLGILPGTLWCGRRDQAPSYHHLGPRTALDSCCRTHDHCPVKLLPMAARYSLVNVAFSTKLHCQCELEFYRCLKGVRREPLADTVGQLYFNLLRSDCIGTPTTTRRRQPSRQQQQQYNQRPREFTSLSPPPGYVSTPPPPNGPRKNESPPSQTETAGKEETRRQLPKLRCSVVDGEGGCRMWLFNPKATVRYSLRPSKLTF